MADLGRGPLVPSSGNGRAQNGGSRATTGPVPVTQQAAARVLPPTEIMKRRRDRDEKKAEIEARQKAQQEAEQRRLQGERRVSADRRATAAGVADTGGDTGARTVEEERRRSDRATTGNLPRVNPGVGVPPSTYPPTGSRIQDPLKVPRAGSDPSNLAQPVGRERAASATQPGSRPIQPQASRAASATYSNQQQQSQTRLTSAPGGTNQAQAGQSAAASSQRPQAATSTGTQQRNNTSSFPHAFERWETLSSHWEGLTNYWIKRLEGNGDEMSGQPLNQQLARQVTDLSAAGANLFHAVVELQRLRASSERKFQRWFYETRSEQERTQEKIAQLEAALAEEKRARSDSVNGGALVQAERAAAEEMKRNAEQALKEMRRELQISKDEAKRSWEEIGRIEQAERDRTTSLKNGEPTIVGGVQVVPMLQGNLSRGTSTVRPPNPSGELASLGGSTLRAAQQDVESPGEREVGYTNYDPARSETDTDPFTEGGHEPSSRLSAAPAPTQPFQQSSSTSAAAIQAARAATGTLSAPSHRSGVQATSAPPPITGGGTYLSYGPGGAALPNPTSGSFYQQQGTATSLLPQVPTQPRVSEADERSYVPSVEDDLSEEAEYVLDERGEIRRDAQGQPLIFSTGTRSEDSDEYNVQEALDRERMYGQRYGSSVSGVDYGQGSTVATGVARPSVPVFAGNGQGGPADYSGSGFGWEAVPRHHHPTRLSDVLEEDERSRTSPSRASERSRGLH